MAFCVWPRPVLLTAWCATFFQNIGIGVPCSKIVNAGVSYFLPIVLKIMVQLFVVIFISLDLAPMITLGQSEKTYRLRIGPKLKN